MFHYLKIIMMLHLCIIMRTHFIILLTYCVLDCSFQNITDLLKCKLTHFGLDYDGEIDKTEGGVRCQSWSAKNPIHKIDDTITDDMFPERSKEKARNFCRNPKRKEYGPWCYSMDAELIDDSCGIPLCSFSECRLTGPGMEYAGQHNRAVSDKKCLKWDKTRKKVIDNRGDYYKQDKFSVRRFPDETRSDADKYCRNPDGDPGGPWCFVDAGKGTVEKQYCDIPFCDVEECVTFTRNFNTYTHYTLFNSSLTNLTFGIKRWHPDELEPNAKLLLSLFALPLTGDEINELQIGIEIYISNHDSAMTVGNKEEPEYETRINMIKSSSFTFFSLSWSSGFVTLTVNNEPKPLFLAEYKWKKGLFNANRDKFFQYSIQGTNILWSLPFCMEDYQCEIHTTTSNNFERFWPLRHTNSSHDLKIYLRAFHSVNMLFQHSPVKPFPRIKLSLGQISDNVSKIVLYEHEKAGEVELKRVTVFKILNYWEWRQFTITFFGDTIQVYWDREVGTQLVLEVKHDKLSGMRWYSPGSDNSVALWTFFCPPDESASPPKPWPPECVLNSDEIGYKGTQSVTRSGHPCLPWTHDIDVQSKMGNKEIAKIWNYCRDPYDEKKGTFCHAVNLKSDKKFVKEKCNLEFCRSSECRMAGTGNDYIGKLNTTRSNRTCQFWTSNEPHKVNKTFLNESYYADQDLKLAKNYCRDPSRNIAGSWCYTTDKNVPRDVCNIRDCVHTEECIIMTKGSGEGRSIYILPEWKDGGINGGLHFALKEWNPDLLDGIIFEITPLDDKPGFIKLVIGAEENERVLIYYSKTNRNSAKLVKEKTLPHLIPAGSWAAFWLQMRRGEIFLGYEGTSEPLFTWEHDNKAEAFDPGFFTYMSIQGNFIGVHFKCTECHTEKTFTNYVTRVMPLRLWYTTETSDYKNKSLSIYARGKGVLLIPLLLLPGEGLDYYAFAIGDRGTYIIFLLNMANDTKTLAYTRRYDVLKPDVWTHYYFTFTEHTIEVFKDNRSVLTWYNKEIMLFYWFAITVESGHVTWAANCDPPDIDGAPRDGGWSEWSPWQCTVSCGGGTGTRHRTCTNPRPNIRGKLCVGPYSDIGTCNEFECGDLSPNTLDYIRQRLKDKHFSLIVKEGERDEIQNDKEILALIDKESPKASYQWTLNGVYLKAKEGKIEFTNDGIVITSATRSKDSGLYVCVLYRVRGERLVIKVVSLAVISKQPDIEIRATLDMTLVCNSAFLGYIYTDLAQAWIHNDKIYIDYGITTLAAVVTQQIEAVNFSHSGNWTCRVTQSDLKLNWIIDSVRIHVKGPPTWITHLMEDEFTKPIFGNLSETNVVITFVTIIVATIVLVAVGLIIYLKYGTLPKRQYKRLRNKN